MASGSRCKAPVWPGVLCEVVARSCSINLGFICVLQTQHAWLGYIMAAQESQFFVEDGKPLKFFVDPGSFGRPKLTRTLTVGCVVWAPSHFYHLSFRKQAP